VTVAPDPTPLPSVDTKPSPLAPTRSAAVLPLPISQPTAPVVTAPSAQPEPTLSPQPVVVDATPANPDLPQADREAALVPTPPSRKQFALAEQPPPESPHVALPDLPPVISATLRPPPASVKLPVAGTAPPPIVVHAAQSGRLIWTGYLERREVLEFDGSKPSVGSVSGTLPGRAVKLGAFPGEFKRDLLTIYTTDAAKHERGEAAGPLTGFNRLHFIWDPERVKQIAVVEAPTAANHFARLILRNEGKSCRAILVEWRTE
ncbi:MAG TPA: hypothetical protein VNV86_06690, partial [Candidatus Acidoferrum sp.]|nr:hypothetical protein [Candidatus Acidoferrum sp.]